jgi:hypothetical protein
MSQKITLHVSAGPARKCTLAFREADHADAEGACPACGVEPFGVVGKNMHHTFDTYIADGHCTACKAHVGELRVKVNTLFGIDEDEAVLNGRCRVY